MCVTCMKGGMRRVGGLTTEPTRRDTRVNGEGAKGAREVTCQQGAKEERALEVIQEKKREGKI